MSPIDDIKDRLDLSEYIGRDTPLHREGNHHKALCPFRTEGSPSFQVWPDHAHCYSCGWHGDIFDYLMARDHVDFGDALRSLAKDAGVTLVENIEAAKERREHAARTTLFRQVAEFYHGLLPSKNEAQAYLDRRGFRAEFIASYLIGWAPGDCVRRSGIADAELQRLGLLNAAGRDYFWNRIIFPVWGRYNDEIVDLAGRILGDGEPKYLKLPGPSTLINERALKRDGPFQDAKLQRP